MGNDFSLFEMRLMQTLLARNTPEEIADLVQKPVEAVVDYVQNFSAAKNIKTIAQINSEKEKLKARHTEWKLLQKKAANADAETARARKKEMQRIHRARQVESIRKRKHVDPSFATRHQDFSRMVSIRIDHKTIIFAKPGEDAEMVKRKYLQNLKSSAPVSPASKNVHVSKFKPIK